MKPKIDLAKLSHGQCIALVAAFEEFGSEMLRLQQQFGDRLAAVNDVPTPIRALALEWAGMCNHVVAETGEKVARIVGAPPAPDRTKLN